MVVDLGAAEEEGRGRRRRCLGSPAEEGRHSARWGAVVLQRYGWSSSGHCKIRDRSMIVGVGLGFCRLVTLAAAGHDNNLYNLLC